MPAEVVLEARGLVKDYRRARAVDGIDVVVHAGERVALLGPNGAGKTTTLFMILGVVAPDAGSISVCGFDLARRPQPGRGVRRLRRGVPAAHRAHARAASTCGSTASSTASPIPSPRIEEGLERFRISHLADAMGTELSSGQRTLIGIVRSTLHRPRLLVLDEPTASLDPDVALRVREGLIDVADQRRHRAAHDESRHDRRRAGVRAGAVPLAGPRRRRRHARRRSRRRTAAATSKACSSTSPATARSSAAQQTRSPMSTPGRSRADAERAVVAAHARDRAPARLRARAQPAPPLRRHAVAAGRRRAVRFARRVRRDERQRRARRRRPATCSPASSCGT